MINHTRKIAPLMRQITATTHPSVTIHVKRVRPSGFHRSALWMVVGHVHELDGHGDSQGVVQEFMLARWDTRTGDLFVEDGDRVSGGPWDHYRNTARANKDALDRLAEYGMAKGREYVVHTEIPRVARARHFKITAEG